MSWWFWARMTCRRFLIAWCSIMSESLSSTRHDSKRRHHGNRIWVYSRGIIMNALSELSRCGAMSLNLWQVLNEILFNKFPRRMEKFPPSTISVLHSLARSLWSRHDEEYFNFNNEITHCWIRPANESLSRPFLITIIFDSSRAIIFN